MDKDDSGERSREHLFHLRHLSITVLIFICYRGIVRCLCTINSIGIRFIPRSRHLSVASQSPALKVCTRRQEAKTPGKSERPHCERTPGGIGVSAREAHRSAHSQCPRALTVHAPLPNKQHKERVYPHPLTPNKTRTVSHRALVKTQKASLGRLYRFLFRDITRFDVPLHLGLISHELQDKSLKASP